MTDVLDALRRAAALLAGDVPHPDVVTVADRALGLLAARLQNQHPADAVRVLLWVHGAAVDLPAEPPVDTKDLSNDQWLEHCCAALHGPLSRLVLLAVRDLGAPERVVQEIGELEAAVGAALARVTPLLPDPHTVPIAAFHGAFSPQARPAPTADAIDRHGEYALVMHLELRRFEHDHQHLTQAKLLRNLYDYGIPLRRLVSLLPPCPATPPRPDLPEDIVRSAIARLARWYRAQRGPGQQGQYDKSTIQAHIRMLLDLLVTHRVITEGPSRPPHGGPHVGVSPLRPTTIGHRQLTLPPNLLDDSGDDDASPADVGLVTVTRRMPREATDDGEAPEDYGVTRLVHDDPDLDPFSAIVRLERARAAHARAFVGSVATCSVLPDALVALAHSVDVPAPTGVAPVDLAIAFLLTPSMSLARLFAMRWYAGEVDGQFALDPEGVLIYRLPRDSVGYYGRPLPGGSELYLPSSSEVHVPLPVAHARLAQAVFRARRPHDVLVFPDLRKADVDWEISRRLGREATAGEVRASALIWLGAAGLERVHAMFMGAPAFGTRSTAFYVRVEVDQLVQVRETAFHGLGKLSGLQMPRSFMSSVRSSGPVAVGSRLDVHVGHPAAFFRTMRERITSLRAARTVEECIRVHNLVTSYVYPGYLWGTAVRPHRDGLPARADIWRDARGTLIRVADKDNPVFREARLITAHPTVARLLTELERGRQRILHLLNRYHGVDVENVGGEPFFYIAGHRLVPVTPATFRDILRQEGLLPHSPFPLNVPRHHWLSYAVSRGIPLDCLEPAVGHVHLGNEDLAWYSLQPHARSMAAYQRVASDVLRQVGVDTIRYPELEVRP